MASSLKPYPETLPEVSIGALQGHILGSDLTPAESEWFITSGAQSKRNTLTTEEKIITRAINALEVKLNTIETSTNAFSDRMNKVVGIDTGEDEETFNQIGMNLINAVAELRQASNSLINIIGTKLDIDFLSGNYLVQDVKIEESVPKKSFSIKRILADPSNPATANWLYKDTVIQSSDGVIQINVSGTEENQIIDLSIPEIDGGIFDK